MMAKQIKIIKLLEYYFNENDFKMYDKYFQKLKLTNEDYDKYLNKKIFLNNNAFSVHIKFYPEAIIF